MIVQNNLHVTGFFKDHVTSRNLTKLFKRILKNRTLPDMFFLVHIQDELHTKDIPENQH